VVRAGAAGHRAGRHGLPIYLIHQPVLYGGLALLAMLYPAPVPLSGPAPAPVPALDAATRAFLENCEARCRETGGAPAGCTRSCGCVADGTKRAGLWTDLLANRLTPESRARILALVEDCRKG
jgi:uncharacterized membrane protein